MALGIKNTPILKDKSSKRFNDLIKEQRRKKVSIEEKKRIDKLVEKIISQKK